jgi:hypothetical protein
VNPARPELIFVRGPQQGERAVMMTNAVLVGRSPAADVRLTEQTASREQVRFTLSPEGWLMENLSTNGTRINGKNYKKKKKLILETGDILTVGLETEILYVSPGDDPEEAIAEYRQADAPKELPAAKEPPAPAAAAAKPQAKPAAGKAPQAEIDLSAAGAAKAGKEAKAAKNAKGAKDAKALQEAVEQDGEKEQIKGKKLKVVLFSVVLIGMLGLGAAMAIKTIIPPPPPGSTNLARLEPADIVEALGAPFPEKPSSPVKAAEALNRAVQSFTNRNLWGPGDLYRCVRDFKLYRAYKQTAGFADVRYERMAEQAERELEKLVCEKYEVAWKFEMARNWRQAKSSYEELMRILPVEEVSKDDPKGPIRRLIIENVIKHITSVQENIGKVKEY